MNLPYNFNCQRYFHCSPLPAACYPTAFIFMIPSSAQKTSLRAGQGLEFNRPHLARSEGGLFPFLTSYSELNIFLSKDAGAKQDCEIA